MWWGPKGKGSEVAKSGASGQEDEDSVDSAR